MIPSWIRILFAVSALYDGLLGVTFLFFGESIFSYFGIPLPNHAGYIHFPAMLMIVFAAAYWRIALDPQKFKLLIPYGMGLKLSYCVVVFAHKLTGGIPFLWIPFAWFDLLSLLLFAIAWRILNTHP